MTTSAFADTSTSVAESKLLFSKGGNVAAAIIMKPGSPITAFDLLGKGLHFTHHPVAMLTIQNDLATSWAEIARHRCDDGGFALVVVG